MIKNHHNCLFVTLSFFLAVISAANICELSNSNGLSVSPNFNIGMILFIDPQCIVFRSNFCCTNLRSTFSSHPRYQRSNFSSHCSIVRSTTISGIWDSYCTIDFCSSPFDACGFLPQRTRYSRDHLPPFRDSLSTPDTEPRKPLC